MLLTIVLDCLVAPGPLEWHRQPQVPLQSPRVLCSNTQHPEILRNTMERGMGVRGPKQGLLGWYLGIIGNLIPAPRRMLCDARKCLPFLYKLRL